MIVALLLVGSALAQDPDTNAAKWIVIKRPKPPVSTNAPSASGPSTNAVIPAVGKLQVLGSKWVWGQFQTAEVIGCVRNNTGDSYRYVQVTANFYSKSGALLGSSMANVLNLGPHEKWIFKIPVLNPEADSWRISAPEGSSF